LLLVWYITAFDRVCDFTPASGVDGADEHAARADTAAPMHTALLMKESLLRDNNVIFLLLFLLPTGFNTQIMSEFIDELGLIIQQWRRVHADFFDVLLLHENR